MSKPPVVIGAGICGTSCALWLRRSGHDVILLDKSEPGMGAFMVTRGFWPNGPMFDE